MVKRTIASILTGMVVMGMVGCSSKKDEANNVAPMQIEAKEALPGQWSKDFTRDEVSELNEEILARVEETALNYGLQYEVTEEVKTDSNGLTINDNHINIDIQDPELNRLESMYYGFKQYGSDLASGQLVMKLTSLLDKDAIKEEGAYDFGATSLATFSQAFTGAEERDYTELNKEIYDMIIGNDEVATVENNLDGLKETISISDNFLLYTLQTKEYQFK